MSNCSVLCCTKIENLTVKNNESIILDNINLHFHCGEITAIVGPNGAGKSTLLRSVIGEVKHLGELKFVGENGDIKPVIGYVPQSISFEKDSPVSVSDLFLACTSRLPVCFFRKSKQREAVIRALEKVKAQNLIDRKLAVLSGGELQRVFLALALMPIPNILLLDEPISGVDKNGIELFWQILSELRKNYDLSIIIISHNLSQVKQYADRVVLMDKKILALGKPNQVFSSNEFNNIFNKGE